MKMVLAIYARYLQQIFNVQNTCTKGQIKVKDTFMSATSTDTVNFTDEETFLLNQIYLSCIKHSK